MSTNAPTQGIELGGRRFEPGQAGHVAIPMVTDLDGSIVSLHVHVVAGAQSGPTLAVVTGLHGGEWLATDVLLALANQVTPKDLAGTLLLIPVANPIAFASGTRNIVDESDSPDLNRSFGGVQAWLADQMAMVISASVLSVADAVIDFHSGLWGAAMGSVTCGRDFVDPAVSRRSYELARAFGLAHVRRGDLATKFPGPKSMIGYAGQVLGIPGIISEVGGAGFDPALEETWLQRNLSGVRGVMRELEMLPGAPTVADEIVVFDAVRRVNPTVGGILEPVLAPDALMEVRVEPGELLGTVWSPYSFSLLEELRAPVPGLVDMVARPYPVRPGDWAYLMVDTTAPGTRILRGDELP